MNQCPSPWGGKLNPAALQASRCLCACHWVGNCSPSVKKRLKNYLLLSCRCQAWQCDLYQLRIGFFSCCSRTNRATVCLLLSAWITVEEVVCNKLWKQSAALQCPCTLLCHKPAKKPKAAVVKWRTLMFSLDWHEDGWSSERSAALWWISYSAAVERMWSLPKIFV